MLKDGTEVAVKVLRPGVERAIARDVLLLETAAGLVERLWADGRRPEAARSGGRIRAPPRRGTWTSCAKAANARCCGAISRFAAARGARVHWTNARGA
jgi:hypothetical protein